ncbi:hypothetical protein OA90_00465 [Labrenzia sp. OB1]|nr:hypothetical protein OA90_00465 [Labrenzia sp. OB1]
MRPAPHPPHAWSRVKRQSRTGCRCWQALRSAVRPCLRRNPANCRTVPPATGNSAGSRQSAATGADPRYRYVGLPAASGQPC